MNMSGVLIAKTGKTDAKAGMNKAVMNLQDLPNGAYFLRVNCGDQQQIKKVIINK